MMRAAILMVLMSAIAGTASAQDNKSEWRFIGGSTTGADFFAKSDSRTKVKGTGDTSYQIDAKHVRPNGQVRLIRYQISERDCQRQRCRLHVRRRHRFFCRGARRAHARAFA